MEERVPLPQLKDLHFPPFGKYWDEQKVLKKKKKNNSTHTSTFYLKTKKKNPQQSEEYRFRKGGLAGVTAHTKHGVTISSHQT